MRPKTVHCKSLLRVKKWHKRKCRRQRRRWRRPLKYSVCPPSSILTSVKIVNKIMDSTSTRCSTRRETLASISSTSMLVSSLSLESRASQMPHTWRRPVKGINSTFLTRQKKISLSLFCKFQKLLRKLSKTWPLIVSQTNCTTFPVRSVHSTTRTSAR